MTSPPSRIPKRGLLEQNGLAKGNITMSDPAHTSEKKARSLGGVRAIHLTIGWGMLLFFACLGITLEILHGFKIGWYLDVGNETRRLMFTLAHAHGTLIGLIHIAFATSLGMLNSWAKKSRDLASRALKVASIFMPGGFFAGGIVIHDGDPGIGIFLVPIGAFALIVSFVLTLSAVRRLNRD